MALDKQNLNVLLGAETRRKGTVEAQFIEKGTLATQETFAKRNTVLGRKDGEVLNGIKSLGQTTNSSEEVITSAIGLVTDQMVGINGIKANAITATFDTVLDSDGNFLRYKLPTDSAGSLALASITADSNGELFRGVGRDSDDAARSFGTKSTNVTALTGLPALRANVPTAALAVVSDGTPQSIAECIKIVDSKKAADLEEIKGFTDIIEAMKPPASVSGGLFGKISQAMSAISLAGGLSQTLGQIAPIGALNDELKATFSTVEDSIKAFKLPGNIGTVDELITLSKNVMSIPGELLATAGDAVTNMTDQFAQDAINKFQSYKDELSEFADVQAVLDTDLADVKTALQEFDEAAQTFDTNFDIRTEAGGDGVLQNFAEKLSGAASAYIENLVPGGISSSEQERIEILKQFASGDPKQEKAAVKTLAGKSPNISDKMKEILDKDPDTSNTLDMQIEMIEEARRQGVPEQQIAKAQQEVSLIEQQMQLLNTTISGQVIINADLFDEGEPIDQSSKWAGRNSPDDMFTYISSVEELDAEFTNIFRQVTELVIHATDTVTNKDIGAVEINNLQIELGHDGIGYHYVIRRDGRLQRGRPPNNIGDHATTNGHDQYSIGIALVGGINVSAGENNATDYRSSQAFTREQFTTLEKFCNSFYRKYPGGQVFGHNDIDVSEFDPYFDVQDYVESIFRKTNKTIEPLSTGPLTPTEINKS